jgi:flagellar biosynthesis protein FlhG
MNIVADQADGLRRLLAKYPTRIIAVAGMNSGVGATTVAMNLAVALAQEGREVLLLDEHCPRDGTICAVWSLDPAGTLDDAIRASSMASATKAACGVSVLPAPPGALPPGANARLLCQAGVIVIDAALDGDGRLSPLGQGADEVVLVLQPDASSITATYAGLKRLHQAHGIRRFRPLVNAVTGAAQAGQIMGNLATASSRHLAAVLLQPGGWVRSDANVTPARGLGQTVIEAFPASAAAVDFRRIAAAAARWSGRPAAGAQSANE